MGHAIYTLSDPRAVILKAKARKLAEQKGFKQKLGLYELVEKLSPAAFLKITGNEKVICANVDLFMRCWEYQRTCLPLCLLCPELLAGVPIV